MDQLYDDKKIYKFINVKKKQKIYELKEYKTVIIITHNQKLLDKCDKIYKIEKGKFNRI